MTPYYNQYLEYTTRGGTIITPCQLDLGVHVTPNPSWIPHINILADKGSQLIAWVLSIFSDRSELTMMTQKQAGVPITTLAPIKDGGYKDS